MRHFIPPPTFDPSVLIDVELMKAELMASLDAENDMMDEEVLEEGVHPGDMELE